MKLPRFRVRTILLFVLLTALALGAVEAMKRRRLSFLRQAERFREFAEAYAVDASMEEVEWTVLTGNETSEELALRRDLQQHFDDKAYLRQRAAYYSSLEQKYLHAARYPFLPMLADPPPD